MAGRRRRRRRLRAAAGFLRGLPVSLALTGTPPLVGPPEGGGFPDFGVWISEIFYNCFPLRSRCGAYPRLSTRRPVAMPGGSRVLPALCGPSRGAASAPRRRNHFPEGVSQTTSGKFSSRIVLEGKRYNLGSTFKTPEEAAAVYEAAKRDGVTDRPSPKKNLAPRGTGLPFCQPPHYSCFDAFITFTCVLLARCVLQESKHKKRRRWINQLRALRRLETLAWTHL